MNYLSYEELKTSLEKPQNLLTHMMVKRLNREIEALETKINETKKRRYELLNKVRTVELAELMSLTKIHHWHAPAIALHGSSGTVSYIHGTFQVTNPGHVLDTEAPKYPKMKKDQKY